MSADERILMLERELERFKALADHQHGLYMAAAAQLAAIRKLHRDGLDLPYCYCCGEESPCPTRRILDGEDDPT